MAGQEEQVKRPPSKITQLMSMRESGYVRRVHTQRWVGEYNLAMHGWQCVTLLLRLHPSPSMELVKVLLWHDVPERFLGDLPAPALWGDTELATAYERLDRQVLDFLGIPNWGDLSPEDKLWFGAIDKIELYMSVSEQLMIGNNHVTPMQLALKEWFSDNPIPEECKEFIKDYVPGRVCDETPRRTSEDS